MLQTHMGLRDSLDFCNRHTARVSVFVALVVFFGGEINYPNWVIKPFDLGNGLFVFY